MGLNGGSMGLGFTLTARDLASGVLRKVEQQFRSLDQAVGSGGMRMSDSFHQLGTAAAALALGMAPLAAAFAAAHKAGDFVQGLAAVGAATGATTQQMRALHDAAMQAGIATQYSPGEAVGGLIALATAGQTATQSIDTLRPSLDLAAASLGQLDVAQASEAIVGTLNSYAFSADKAVEITDKLVQTTMLTNFQARDFAVGLARAAEAGSLYGQSLDDILVGMGLLRNRNIAADVASTALRNALIRVNSDVRSQNILLRAGVPLRDAYTGQLRSILDVITDFAGATRHLDPLSLNTMVKDIFGEEGMPAFSAIMNATFTAIENGTSVTYKGAGAIAALRRELQQSGGAAGRFVARYNDNFQGQMTLLQGSIHGLWDLTGEVFGEILNPMVSGLTNALNGLLALLMAIPMPLKKMAGTALLAAGGAVSLAAGMSVAGKAWGLLKLGLLGLRGIFSPMLVGLAAFSAPVLATIAAVMAAVALLGKAYRANVGHMADLAGSGPGGAILLFWQGLGQVMDSGALRGDVLMKLHERGALKDMVVGFYQAVRAVRAFGHGVDQGFSRMSAVLGPYFTLLGASLRQFQVQVERCFAMLFGAKAGASMRPFLLMGQVLGGVFGVLAATVSVAATAFIFLLDVAVRTLQLLAGHPEAWLDMWRTWGATAIGLGVRVGAYFATWWQSSQLGALCRDLEILLPQAAARAVDRMLQVFRTLRGALTDSMAPVRQILARIFSADLPWMPSNLRADSAGAGVQVGVAAPHPEASAMASQALPAAVEIRERLRTSYANAHSSSAAPAAQGPISLAVQIDGETVARAVTKANRQSAARRYAPLVGY